MNDQKKIIIALDFTSQKEVINFLNKLNPDFCRVKIGLRLFIKYGPKIVEQVMNMGYSVFLDLKLHDIPSQVEASCRIIADLGVWMTTVHTLGGVKMCAAASNTMSIYRNPPKIIGVTVLTSTDQEELLRSGMDINIRSLIVNLGKLAEKSGLDGVVCSALDIKYLKNKFSKNLLFVTPGIRTSFKKYCNVQDQKRITTPKIAVDYGSNYLVIGRSIIDSKEPMQKLEEIYRDIL